MPDSEIRAAHGAAKNHIDLIDTHEAEYGVEARDLHLGLGFLQSLPSCCLLCGFIELHEAGGKRPQTPSWFNGPAAQKDLTFPFGKAACDDLRILVMDRLARLAHKTQQGLPGRNFPDNRLPTLTAIPHHRRTHWFPLSRQVYHKHPPLVTAGLCLTPGFAKVGLSFTRD